MFSIQIVPILSAAAAFSRQYDGQQTFLRKNFPQFHLSYVSYIDSTYYYWNFFFIRDYFLCIWKMISSYLFKINICCRYSFYPSFCFLIFSCLMFVTCFARNFLSFKVKKVSLNKAENSIRHFGELYTLHPWLFSECVH